MNDRVLVGGGTTGFYRRVDGATLTAGTYDFRIRFYPARRSGFFVNGGFDVLSHRIVTDMHKGLYPSDHFPVQATLRMR